MAQEANLEKAPVWKAVNPLVPPIYEKSLEKIAAKNCDSKRLNGRPLLADTSRPGGKVLGGC